MSQVATAVVVDGKLDPISKSEPIVPAQFTAQAAINLYSEFTTAVNSAAGKQCAILQSFAIQTRNADVGEVKSALSGVVEYTRSTVDNKRQDGPETPMARKFQSMARAIFGAVRFAGFGLMNVKDYVNSQALYDDCRKALADAGIDWSGMLDADKVKAKAHKEAKKAVDEAATEAGIDSSDILTLTPEQLASLKSAASAKIAQKKAKEKLESMEKRAEKLAADLIKSYGIDDAETVLKMALEKLLPVMVGQAA